MTRGDEGGGEGGEGGIFLIMGKWSGQMLFTSRQAQIPRLWLVRSKYLACDWSRLKPPNWLVKTKYLSSDWSRLKPPNWL